MTAYTGKLKSGTIYHIQMSSKSKQDQGVTLGISKSINSKMNFVRSDNQMLENYPSYGYDNYQGVIYHPSIECRLDVKATAKCKNHLKNNSNQQEEFKISTIPYTQTSKKSTQIILLYMTLN